jgi:TolA-binding protein
MVLKSIFSILNVALAVCLCAMSLNAAHGADRDDDGALVPEGPVEKPAKPKSEPPIEADDDDLLDAVSPRGKKAGDEEADRLERAINGMWNAKTRVAGRDTGRQTQEIQNQVVKDLEELLALLKKQQQNRQNNPQPNRDQEQNGDQSPNQRQKTQKGQGDPQNSSAKNEPQGGRRNEGKSSDSQELTDPARAAAAEEARRARLIKDVWGHLPPHLRTAMQNAFSENYLPKYEDLVKKYYEALAEKNRKRPARGDTRIAP